MNISCFLIFIETSTLRTSALRIDFKPYSISSLLRVLMTWLAFLWGRPTLEGLRRRVLWGRGTYVKVKSLGGVNMVKLNKL